MLPHAVNIRQQFGLQKCSARSILAVWSVIQQKSDWCKHMENVGSYKDLLRSHPGELIHRPFLMGKQQQNDLGLHECHHPPTDLHPSLLTSKQPMELTQCNLKVQ